MLTKQDYEFFNKLQDNIKRILNVNINIILLNHAEVLGDSDILGSCHRFFDKNNNLVKVLITIDTMYTEYCIRGRQVAYSKYSVYTLTETICHEIAHLFVWEHGPEHTQLTQDFYRLVKQKIFT